MELSHEACGPPRARVTIWATPFSGNQHKPHHGGRVGKTVAGVIWRQAFAQKPNHAARQAHQHQKGHPLPAGTVPAVFVSEIDLGPPLSVFRSESPKP